MILLWVGHSMEDYCYGHEKGGGGRVCEAST